MNRQELESEITALKYLLSDSDYKALKYAEGEISETEYAPIKTERAKWRQLINEYQAMLSDISK